MTIRARSKGSVKRTYQFLDKLKHGDFYDELDRFGRMGVDALASATPVRTGETANSWAYEVTRGRRRSGIVWYNTNTIDGVNVAILLQYGHGTGTGGYVSGYDYINPAIRPIFDRIANDVWRKITLA